MSMTSRGISDKTYTAFSDKIQQIYGWEVIVFLERLKRLGVLSTYAPDAIKAMQQSLWSTLKQSFDLVMDIDDDRCNELKDNVNIVFEERCKEKKQYFTKFVQGPHADEDLFFLYETYVPLSLRILEFALENQWAVPEIKKKMDLIKGLMFNESASKKNASPKAANASAPSELLADDLKRIESSFHGHRSRTVSEQRVCAKGSRGSGYLQVKSASFPWYFENRWVSVSKTLRYL